MKKLVMILAAFGLMVTNVGAQTHVPGHTITGDEVWDIGGSPYLVTGVVDIITGASLTIEPGVLVDFGTTHIEFGVFRVWGEFLADDVEFDGTNVAEANNWFIIEVKSGGAATLTGCTLNGRWTPPSVHGKDWRGLEVTGTNIGQVTVNDCQFTGFNNGIHMARTEHIEVTNCHFSNCNAGIGVQYGTATITNCSFEDIQINAITLAGGPQYAGALATIQQCSFSSSPSAVGVQLSQDASATINFSCFSGMGTAVNNITTTTIDAENNWWNSVNGPTHASNPGGDGEVVVGDVDFDPFLGSDPGCGPTNLIAHWSFDDCTATDVTGNGHDGIMDDDPVCITAPCGQAWSPDGINDEIEITGNLEDLMFANQSLSISMWVQITDNPNAGRTYFYIGRDQSYSSNAEIAISKIRSGNMDGRLQMYVGHHGALYSAAYSIATGEELPKNEWLHLAGVIDYENQSVRFYINGVFQDESADLIDFDLSTGSKPFRAHIGAYEHNEFQNGPVDEVRVYDRVLSETEILELYENCASGPGQPVCSAFLTPRRVAIRGSGLMKGAPRNGECRNRNRHSFKIHLLPCEPIDISVGDSADVFVDVDASGTFDDGEQYPAVVSSTDIDGTASDIAIKVFVGRDLIDNDPMVAIYSVAGQAIVDSDGNDIDYLRLETFTPGSHGLASGDGNAPDGYALLQNAPNPFNATTTIHFSLQEANNVQLVIYDILGRQICRLTNDYLPAGNHSTNWAGVDDRGRPVASGMYFYRLTTGEFTETRKMVLMK